MKRLYREFFYIPKHGKICEKVMLTRLVVFITIVLTCLAAMSLTAYAYFSYNVTSGDNAIKAASFEAKISIKAADTDVPITQIDNVTYTAELTPDNTYSVTVEKVGDASTGFCKISASGCEIKEYHTRQLGFDVSSSTEKM